MFHSFSWALHPWMVEALKNLPMNSIPMSSSLTCTFNLQIQISQRAIPHKVSAAQGLERSATQTWYYCWTRYYCTSLDYGPASIVKVFKPNDSSAFAFAGPLPLSELLHSLPEHLASCGSFACLTSAHLASASLCPWSSHRQGFSYITYRGVSC